MLVFATGRFASVECEYGLVHPSVYGISPIALPAPPCSNPRVTTALSTETAALDALLRRISTREARVGVIGLGYVGLPLVLLFERNGFPVFTSSTK